ncbi:MAG: PilT/PilU family type 4a pilus ATPase [Actinomycetota bacterium]|nr:PilT/PilU family type 4a pilus ATPase [Acidimicrobiia bacterium]MDQ3294201.1 PilT/PilU family type 4a pilus ATPase [Actinomycetota bacterium]
MAEPRVLVASDSVLARAEAEFDQVSPLPSTPGSSPTTRAWIECLWTARGTDLHLAVGAPPAIRVNGALRPMVGVAPLTDADVRAVVADLLGERTALLESRKEVDFGFTWQDKARIRANAFHERGGLGLALRMIPFAIPSLESLGLPPVVEQFSQAPSGLVIVTGPTGSGKSTTLASLLDDINRTRPCHIVTIEDPIEYVHNHRAALVHQREIGEDAESFPSALRAVLREDPDVVLVGEMRDIDSIQTTLTIAETGHLVFASLHTNDTAQAVDRIVDVFPAEGRAQIQVQLASTLRGIVYQRLLPRISGGLVGAHEVLVANHAVRNMIREGKTRQIRNAIAVGQQDGMQTLEQSLSALVAAGTVEHEVAAAASLHPAEVLRSRSPAGRR